MKVRTKTDYIFKYYIEYDDRVEFYYEDKLGDTHILVEYKQKVENNEA